MNLIFGMYGSLCQIATCIGILCALVIGLPVKIVPGCWSNCFWISILLDALRLFGMEFCSKSPKWLIGAAMFVLQQLSGINVVFYFSPTVFRNAGISSDLFASVSVGIF